MKTILVVDDEKNLRILYKKELSGEGYQVLTAASGEEALEIIRKQTIELAILDIKMEGMDGIQTLREVLAFNRNIKIILNSAYSSYKSDFSTWSADAYLIKSSDLTEMKQKIEELLGA
ncbi:response regulator [candidate division KSB1 bacterium]|nr:response regulator [candidate division KSB1 bacterium]